MTDSLADQIKQLREEAIRIELRTNVLAKVVLAICSAAEQGAADTERLASALNEALIALPYHTTECQKKSVAGAACCYYMETQRKGVAAIAAARGKP